jgi:class 3 adenylate cyclase
MQCPECGHTNRANARFCGACRAAFEREPDCPECGAPNPPQQAFCDRCGGDLRAPAPDTVDPTLEPAREAKSPGAPSVPPTSFASGRYEVERFLGEGGKKRVYLARDTRLDRRVAISVLKPDAVDGDSRLRVEREFRTMASLGEHPHAVNIYDVDQHEGLLYIVCQYVAGGDLALRLRVAPSHRLPLADTLRIGTELCSALEHAHSHGVVHRDITPSNVLISEDGGVKLGDFGLAVSMEHSRLTADGMIVGTVAYMPPEQALGLAPDPRGDLYAVGALLYEMVTGHPPFVGDNAVAIISQHINTPPVAPTWHDPSIPAALEALILELLEKDPDARPGTAARVGERLREIAAGPVDSPAAAASLNPLDRLARGVFVGREAELERMRAGLDEALSGRPRVLMLVGEPGIGKTRTALELATYARMRGAQILWGRCYGGEGVPAYRPWVQIIRDYVQGSDPETLRFDLGGAAGDVGTLVSEVREALPELDGPSQLDPDDARFRLFEGIVSFLRNASTHRPLALVLDDLHWADPSSLQLLEFLAAEIGPARLLILGTYRDEEVGRHHPLGETLAELSRSQQSERILLRGLSREDVARFIERTAHSVPPAPLVDAVFRETEGNPFFVHEAVRLLATDGRLERAREITTWSVEIPQSVREVIGRRLGRLTDDCNAVLRIAAVLGRDFDCSVLLRLIELPEETMLGALDEALAARLIEEGSSPGGYRFAHSLIQQTLYEELNTPRRVRIHQRAGEALEAAESPLPGRHMAEVAHHFLHAVDSVGSTRVADAAVRAGEWAREHLAYEEAAGHYASAVEVLESESEPDEQRICELTIELARLHRLEGDHAAELEASRRAVDFARTLGDDALFARAALVYAKGDFVEPWRVDDRAVALVEEALSGLAPGDSPTRARLLDSLARHSAYSEDPAPRQGYWKEARAIASRLDDSALLLEVSPAISIWDAPQEQWLPIVERQVDLARSQSKSALFEALSWRATVRLQSGDAAGMKSDHVAMERLADELRTPVTRYSLALRRAMEATLEGRLDTATELALEAFETGRRAFEETARQNYLAQMFCILMHRGSARSNRTVIEMADRYADPVYRAILARCYACEGARDNAAEQLAILGAGDFESVTPSLNWGTTLCLVADVCCYLEDTSHAERLYERMRGLPEHFAVGGESGTGQCGPFGMRLGMLASLLGRDAEAEEHFRKTIEWTERAGTLAWLAQTRLEYVRLLATRSEAADPREVLREANRAIDLGRKLGMQGVVEDAVSLKLAAQGLEPTTLSTSIQGVAARMCEQRPDLAPCSGPDGTVTLIFSDIEDYTGMLERLGDLKSHLIVQDHNTIIRSQTTLHEGREVEVRGDGVLLAFPSAARAAQCTIALQRAFADYNESHQEHSIHIRLGLHSGEVIKDADTFFGKSVVHAFRVADLARGREILVSEATRSLIEGSGAFRFDPERLVELKGLEGQHRVSSLRWEQ